MNNFSFLPAVIIRELPKQISSKIELGSSLDESDCRVARMYLDSMITHPEDISIGRDELESVVAFYIHVGAKISTYTCMAVAEFSLSSDLLLKLASYKKKIDRPVIVLRRTKELKGFQSFIIMNADKGPKSWVFYAENLGKLGRHLGKWLDKSAPHLRSGSAYDIYIEDDYIGKVERGEFVSLPDDSIVHIIDGVFGSHANITIEMSIRTNDVGTIGVVAMQGKVVEFPDITTNSRLLIPCSPPLALEYIYEQIDWAVCKCLAKVKNTKHIRCDMSVVITINGEVLGLKDFCSTRASFLTSSKGVLLKSVGRDEEDLKVSFWDKIRGLFACFVT